MKCKIICMLFHIYHKIQKILVLLTVGYEVTCVQKHALQCFISNTNQQEFRKSTDYNRVARDFLFNWESSLNKLEINQWFLL